MSGTYTYTFTKARLELIVDEFEALLVRAGSDDENAAAIAAGVRQRMCTAVTLWAGHASDDTIAIEREVRLSVDWDLHDESVERGEDMVALDEKAWKGGVSPDTRVHVRRFREAVDTQGLDWGVSVTLAPDYSSGEPRDEARRVMNLVPGRQRRWRADKQSVESHLEEAPELTYELSVVHEPQ
jgi:hypothetical protein